MRKNDKLEDSLATQWPKLRGETNAGKPQLLQLSSHGTHAPMAAIEVYILLCGFLFCKNEKYN